MMYKKEKYYYKRAFFYALLLGALLFLPFVIIDGGYFVFYGDYNAQQIPFYKVCIEAAHSGNLGWNWYTDLGANLIGSYSFYTLGSPFFWLAAIFPASISQYLMAPLFALKLACASFFAFIYIRRFVRKPQSALIGGILYAFSGFSMNSVFFNHFHEAIVFFPLLLIGLEEAVINKRRGALALAVAINAFVNYFFFIGECVFLVIYFIARLAGDRQFRINAADFFCLAFESVIGVCIAGALFIPSIFQVLDVPRSTNILTDGNFMFYGTVQRYGLIMEAMFFPPEIAARTNMFANANAKWSSVALYLPLFGMAGAASFIKGAKKHIWAKTVLITSLVMAFVPGLNAAFTMFNNNFYTRWFYMPTLICCLATVCVLENSELDIKFGIKFCTIGAAVMALIVFLHPITKEHTVQNADGTSRVEEYTSLGIMGMDTERIAAVAVQLAMVIGFMIALYYLFKQRKKYGVDHFLQNVTMATLLCSMIMGLYTVGYGRVIGPYVGNYNRAVSAGLQLPEEEFYRIEATDEINNVNMLWKKGSLKSFTSIIPNSTFELYELLGVTRDVNSTPPEEKYALRALTNVRYYIIRSDYDDEKLQELLDKLKIYEYKETQGEYDIYETDYALPMGFSYDTYYSKDKAKGVSAIDNLMVRSVLLTDEQIEKYSDILNVLPEHEARETSYEQFTRDAESRIAAGVRDFTVTNSGFTARTDYPEDELVVFTVPHDRGWTAEINGKPAEIEKVNGGFMAVRVEKGSSSIVFTYETPGLKYGIIASIGGAVLFGLYMLLIYVILGRRPRKYVHLYNENQNGVVRAHRAYVNMLAKDIENAPEYGDVQFPENTVDKETALKALENDKKDSRR